jgi:hypothetical protein
MTVLYTALATLGLLFLMAVIADEKRRRESVCERY